MANDLTYDPYDPAIDENPHPTWRRLRDEAPLYRNDKLGFYALSRYDDVLPALTDWRTYSSGRGTVLELIDPLAPDPEGYTEGQMMIFTDPPFHDTLRGLVSRSFTPRRVGVHRGARPRAVPRRPRRGGGGGQQRLRLPGRLRRPDPRHGHRRAAGHPPGGPAPARPLDRPVHALRPRPRPARRGAGGQAARAGPGRGHEEPGRLPRGHDRRPHRRARRRHDLRAGDRRGAAARRRHPQAVAARGVVVRDAAVHGRRRDDGPPAGVDGRARSPATPTSGPRCVGDRSLLPGRSRSCCATSRRRRSRPGG